ncbi:MAG: Glu/Leu/Phe/Val dehydrogenase [Kiritimatiellae bacterium]|nr:Glu/Leu/Phe/Val dehydrogenase [Kiritimatiellia bacterium]
MIKSDRVFDSLKCEIVREFRDESLGLHAFFALDRSIDGKSVSGVRFTPEVCMEEVQDLARAMTLKQGFLGFPRGGARVGVRSSADIDDGLKQAMVNRVGEWLHEYVKDRNCLLGVDVGTHARHFEAMYRHLGIAVPKHSDSSINSGLYTSMSVFGCMKAAADWVDVDLNGARVAVEGYGRVGAPLAKALFDLGAKVVAISTIGGALYNEDGLNIERLCNMSASNDDGFAQCRDLGEVLEREKLLELPVDILSPCGTDSTINRDNAHRIQARLICSGANNPVTQSARKICRERGVLVLPDFVTNAGGVLGNASAFLGLNRSDFEQLIDVNQVGVLRRIYTQAETQDLSLYDVAENMTLSKISRRPVSSGKKGVVLQAGLRLYKRGLIPKQLTRGYGYRSIVKMIEQGWE